MPIDIERARRDTPAASEVLHFNNAGAALMPAPVLQAQLRHLQLEAEAGGYEAAAAADDRIEAIYDSIARLMVAVDGPAAEFKEPLRRAIQRFNPELPVRTVNTMQEQIEQSLWQPTIGSKRSTIQSGDS